MPRSHHQPGLVVLDTNCLKYLREPAEQRRLFGSLRAADLEVWPTEINLMEAMNTENARIRLQLLEILRELRGERPFLPWPHELIRQAGEALAEGSGEFSARMHRYDELLERAAELTDDELEKIRQFMTNREEEFNSMHKEGRRAVQAFLRAHQLGGTWDTAADFLDSQWGSRDHFKGFAEALWKKLDLPREAPLDELLQNETWRLFFEAHGIAAFERGFEARPPRRTQEADLLQLVYLGGQRRRIIASEDGAFLRSARAVLDRRYPGSRVVHIRELLE